jgi:uncharacterized protein
MMSIETVREVVDWLKNFRDDPVTITFHGGEPLLAGPDFYRQALPLISDELRHMRPSFAIQTNLWRLTPELADIFAQYHIPIGSSIDGPRELNDLQREEGYYDKTMQGYEIAKEHGLSVRFICTFTSHSVGSKEAIFRYFLNNGFVMKLHPALPSLRSENPGQWTLDPVEYGELLVFLLDSYLEHLGAIEIMNINDLVRCVFTRRGSVCTFVNCMGNTFAVGPDGNIYPCYRFVGMPGYVMGNVCDHPSPEDLKQSPAGQLMQQFSDYVDRECRDCRHIRYCRGGCPYNAMAPYHGIVQGVDPHCTAYKRIFDEISDRLNREMFESPGIEMDSPRLKRKRHTKPGIMAIMQKMVSYENY